MPTTTCFITKLMGLIIATFGYLEYTHQKRGAIIRHWEYILPIYFSFDWRTFTQNSKREYVMEEHMVYWRNEDHFGLSRSPISKPNKYK